MFHSQAAAFLCLLFAPMLMVGCGKGPVTQGESAVRHDAIPDQPVIVSQPQNPSIPMESQIEAAKNGSLTCEFEGECEPALTLISVAEPGGLSRCSGFLISDHEVLTNDHCLAAIPDRTDACKGVVFLHFTDQVDRGCKRVTTRSHQTGIDSKDYAVIELDAPVRDRRPLRVSKRGFNDEEKATIFSVQATRNPVNKTYDGQQLKRICQASYHSLMDIHISSSREPLMTFGDCAIQTGNSGSPMINENGEVSAIVQGFLTVNGDAFTEMLKPYLLDESYGEMAIGTQTRCMPELVGNAANSCEALKPLTALYPREYLQAFGIFSVKALPDVGQDLIWKEFPNANENQKTFFSAPKCVSMDEVRLGKSLSFTSNVLVYHQGINARLQAEWRADDQMQTLFGVQRTLSVSPTSADFVSPELGMITVPVCQ